MNSRQSETLLVILLFLLSSVAFFVRCGEDSHSPQIWYEFHTPDSQSGIAKYDPTTKVEEKILEFKSPRGFLRPSLSPDREKIAYYKNTRGSQIAIWLVNANGSSNRQISKEYAGVYFRWRDLDHLLIFGSDNLDWDIGTLELSEYEISTGTVRQLKLAKIGANCISGRFSRTMAKIPITNIFGTHLGYGHLELRGNTLITIEEGHIDLVQLAGIAGDCPALADDGETIAFWGIKGNVANVYVASNDRKTLSKLTDFDKEYKQSLPKALEISPDGKWVAALTDLEGSISGEEPEGSYLFLLKRDGTEIKNLGEWGQQSDENFYWSPDNVQVVTSFVPWKMKGDYGEIYVIDTQTGGYKSILSDRNQKRVFDWR